MTSYKAIRDPVADHLLTPQNAALVIIDFQPVQVASDIDEALRHRDPSSLSAHRARGSDHSRITRGSEREGMNGRAHRVPVRSGTLAAAGDTAQSPG